MPVAFSAKLAVPPEVMLGASFTAVTVRTKVSLVVAVASLTVTVIVAVPN